MNWGPVWETGWPTTLGKHLTNKLSTITLEWMDPIEGWEKQIFDDLLRMNRLNLIISQGHLQSKKRDAISEEVTMRFGVVDLGTNSVRFDAREIGPSGEMRSLYREKMMVRLGQNAFRNRNLDSGAIQRTVEAFQRFRQIASDLKLHKVLAFATATLREVNDRATFIDLIKQKTGFELRVISGLEEARLIALGILANENIPKSIFALVDIGGGSTEITLCKGRKILRSISFPLGAARLQQIFLKKIPPIPEDVSEIRDFIQRTLSQDLQEKAWKKAKLVMGSSGTIRALAKIQKKAFETKDLKTAKLTKLVKRMAPMTLPQLKKIRGIEEKRADLILSGAILFEECMKSLGAHSFTTTQYSLRDGIFEEERRLHLQGKFSHLALHLEDLLKMAVAFGKTETHLRNTVRLAESIFDKLKLIHQVPSKWLIYLLASSILRNVGEAISVSRHSIHTYYMLKNGDLPPMEEWEAELIAQLCLYHDGDALPEKKSSTLDKIPWIIFRKLLALLRLVDALDTGCEVSLNVLRTQKTSKIVKLLYTGKNLTGLESLNVELRNKTFQSVFKVGFCAQKISRGSPTV